MTAHFTGQGAQPTSHPGLDRNIESVITSVAPTLAKARSILIGATINGGALLPQYREL